MIDFVETNPDIVYRESLKRLETTLDRAIHQADPLNLLLSAIVYELVVLKNDINHTANQNLLPFATGEALDKLGEFHGVKRLPAQPARTTLRFYTNEPKTFDIVIPQNTKATPDQKIFFKTTQEAVIKAGNTFVDVEAECETEGTIGNGFLPGQINMLATPLPYITAVENITTSMYGTDTESDEHLRERIRLAPESFSNAGSKGAYIFHTKSAHQDIADVSVFSPSAGQVKVIFILKDGVLPDADMINTVKNYLNDEKIRPLTDQVFVEAPTVVNYDIDFTYYILKDYEPLQAQIQEQVQQAVNDYVLWQKSKIGRDILPEELISRLKAINGVYRIDINQPVKTVLSQDQLAVAQNISINYGGAIDA